MPTPLASSILALLFGSIAALGCARPAESPPPASPEGLQPSIAGPPATSTAPAPPSFAASPPPPPSPTPTSVPTASVARPPPAPDRSQVYRLDFALTANEGSGTVTNTSFSLVLNEGHTGEVVIGKNVPLTPSSAGGSGPTVASPRQDVGLKIKAEFRSLSDQLLLEVSTEMSTFEAPSTIRKVVSQGNALATPGKSALVTSVDEDRKHYQLTVTPTKLR